MSLLILKSTILLLAIFCSIGVINEMCIKRDIKLPLVDYALVALLWTLFYFFSQYK